MRAKTGQWFEIKIRYEKTTDEGMTKPITEQYVVEAFTFTEAEAAIIEEMSSYISGAFDITGIKNAGYKEIFFSENPNDDKWFKVKLQFITLDEKTEKEKRSNVYHLVQASSLQSAVKYVTDEMSRTMIDYSFASITETLFMDVYEHHAADGKPTADEKPEYE
ncbi:MAG: DUF4494 domain-containing protein [Prevotellaceae bacterium]|nr:DUF4494 domain-containing protein [Prevotella sp.]MDD7530695.1 DUF4494 domain-containing protein [Prevotellaceae bacterium]MDY2633217.1 DUF4494 domain-containing protein [Prevotella sp.]